MARRSDPARRSATLALGPLRFRAPAGAGGGSGSARRTGPGPGPRGRCPRPPRPAGSRSSGAGSSIRRPRRRCPAPRSIAAGSAGGRAWLPAPWRSPSCPHRLRLRGTAAGPCAGRGTPPWRGCARQRSRRGTAARGCRRWIEGARSRVASRTAYFSTQRRKDARTQRTSRARLIAGHQICPGWAAALRSLRLCVEVLPFCWPLR